MYIPLTFFSSQGSCITATTTITSGTGSVTTGSFISGGYYWDYYQFNNNANTNLSTASFVANLNVISGSTSQAKLLVVGGGGGGGFNPGDACINLYIDTVGAAGGGGGGGVVYYDQFSISSGSYEISVGAGGRRGDYTTRIGFNGSVSYFNNKSFQYTPFTSSFITAYGGGGGAGCSYNCNPGTGIGIGSSGASSGGGAQTGVAAATVPAVGAYSYTGGNPAVIQGYGAGSITTNPYGNDRAMGGGGAAAASANITDTYNPSAGSPGGSGVFYNLTGTQLGYGAGAGGIRATSTGGGILTGNGAGWGNPGSGGTGGFGGRFGLITGAEPGLNGTIIIAIKRCDAESYGCIVSKFIGIGSSEPSYPFGASFDFIDCNTNTTATLRPNRLNPFGYCISGSLSAINIQPSSTGAFANCQVCSEVITDCETRSAVCGQTSGTITYTPCGQTSSITLAIAGNTGYDVCMSGSYSTTGDVSVGLARGKCYATSSLSCQSYTPCYYRTFKAGASVATASYWQCNATASVTTYISASQSLQVSLNISKPSSLIGTGASVLSYYNCTSYRFTAGPSGGTATFLYCGLGNSGNVVLGANQQITICCVTGTTALTGGGSTITGLGTCVTGSSGLALWP
jgi:hypothetical protein